MAENQTNISNNNEFEITTPQKSDQEITAGDTDNKEIQVPVNQPKHFEKDNSFKNKKIENVGHIASFKIAENEKIKNEDIDRDVKNKKIIKDETNDKKINDAKWQTDKMNEANNQQGEKQKVEEGSGKINIDDEKTSNDSSSKGSTAIDTETKIKDAKDKREDSILCRPKTETYETNQGEDVGTELKDKNYTHTNEEKNRDDLNRKNLEKLRKQAEHTY
jgi:hypothetical protein